MYVFRVTYQHPDTIGYLSITSEEIEGAGFSGYSTVDAAWKSITQWRNRAMNRVEITDIEIHVR